MHRSPEPARSAAPLPRRSTRELRPDTPGAARKRLLFEAHRARNRGRERRAIALYKRLLREEPDSVQVAVRLAPLLARRGDCFEAWQLYRMAARELARERRFKDCLAVYRDACRALPHEFEAWRLRAELEMRLGHEELAFETLLDGRARFRDARGRAQAIALLVRARTLEPWDPDVVLDLARLYARSDQSDAALELLAALGSRSGPRVERRVRALQWRITLAPRHAWAWLRALQRQLAAGGLPADRPDAAATRASRDEAVLPG